MFTTSNRPLNTYRDGSLKATLWKNTGDSGEFYSIRFSRTWKDDQGQYHDSDSFSGAELLRIARLAKLAYDGMVILRAGDRQETA